VNASANSSPRRISPCVNDALYSAAREKLEAIARAAGFEGRLVVLAEPGIALDDYHIEWADGGAHRDSAATETAIADAVARYVSARRGFADSQEILRRSANE
jgi:flagellar assembly protein FliH